MYNNEILNVQHTKHINDIVFVFFITPWNFFIRSNIKIFKGNITCKLILVFNKFDCNRRFGRPMKKLIL